MRGRNSEPADAVGIRSIPLVLCVNRERRGDFRGERREFETNHQLSLATTKSSEGVGEVVMRVLLYLLKVQDFYIRNIMLLWL